MALQVLVGVVDEQLLQAVGVELLEAVDVQHADEAPHVPDTRADQRARPSPSSRHNEQTGTTETRGADRASGENDQNDHHTKQPNKSQQPHPQNENQHRTVNRIADGTRPSVVKTEPPTTRHRTKARHHRTSANKCQSTTAVPAAQACFAYSHLPNNFERISPSVMSRSEVQRLTTSLQQASPSYFFAPLESNGAKNRGTS